jgi:hypothetical protein
MKQPKQKTGTLPNNRLREFFNRDKGDTGDKTRVIRLRYRLSNSYGGLEAQCPKANG